MSPRTLAEQARRQLSNLDAVMDELAQPAKVLSRVPRPRAKAPEEGLERMTLEAAEPPVEPEQVLEDGRRAVEKVRAAADPATVPLSPDEQLGLEAVILLFGRPALLVQNGTFAAPPPDWQVLEAQRATIDERLKSVGRIELLRRGMVGTGFLVAPDVVMTNRHVAEVFSIPSDAGGWTFKLGRTPVIDYLEEQGGTTSATFKVREVIGIHDDVRIDLALLRVSLDPVGDLPAGFTAPPALPVASSAPAETDLEHNVYVVGYPASDNQGITPPDVMTRIFGDIFEVKRLQPGTLTSISQNLPRFSHDCSTLGGNSGSCVFDLETHQVVGLHFGGGFRETNFAVALWKLTGDALLQRAGVQFA
jgi:V8-like Glu-specific endopeptidase